MHGSHAKAAFLPVLYYMREGGGTDTFESYGQERLSTYDAIACIRNETARECAANPRTLLRAVHDELFLHDSLCIDDLL